MSLQKLRDRLADARARYELVSPSAPARKSSGARTEAVGRPLGRSRSQALMEARLRSR